jgi:hypothetical protein
MTESKEEAHGSGRSLPLYGMAWFFVATPLLYVLSIGPVLAFGDKTLLRLEVVEVIYAPVIWLHDHTPLKKPLEWYVDWWV